MHIEQSEDLPTAEESAESPVPPCPRLAWAATPSTRLPCPPGTEQVEGEGCIECRALQQTGWVRGRHGPAIWFHPGGQVRELGQYADHERSGPWWELDEQGRLVSQREYRGGQEHGLRVTYHASGLRASETAVENDQEHGLGKRWNEQGQLESLAWYERGQQVRMKIFRRNVVVTPMTQEQVKEAYDEVEALMAEQRRLLEELKRGG